PAGQDALQGHAQQRDADGTLRVKQHADGDEVGYPADDPAHHRHQPKRQRHDAATPLPTPVPNPAGGGVRPHRPAAGPQRTAATPPPAAGELPPEEGAPPGSRPDAAGSGLAMPARTPDR